MSSRLRAAVGSAVTVAAVLATAACGGASSSAGAPPSTADSPTATHDAVPLDPHRVARATSRSGPVWFRSDLA